MAARVEESARFFEFLAAPGRAPEIPESADVYGWLCGSWELDVARYRGIDVAGRGLKGEVHAARVLEGRAVQDVWIMPKRSDRSGEFDQTMNMYGTTLRWWDILAQTWRINWTNPARAHAEEQVGRWSGHDIVQEGQRHDGAKTRWTFTEIAADSFRWRGEARYPGKDEWTLEAEFRATRMKT
ncbi:MAG TPA: hypothetical protein VH583_18560 [Vicinamibacterales bacterium]|jgi:hypothetical protein